MTDDTPDDKDPAARRRPATPTQRYLRRIAEAVAGVTARPELLSALRLLASPDQTFRTAAAVAALSRVTNPASELAKSILRMQAAAAGLGKLTPSIDLEGPRRIAESLRALEASNGALARTLRDNATPDRRLLAAAGAIRADLDQWKSITGILDRYRASHDAIGASVAKSLMGIWAASLAVDGENAGIGRSWAEAAAVLASARVVVDDASLWEGARGLSVLVDGISSIAGAEARGEQPTEALVAALEREAERAGDMAGSAAGGATVLFSIEYVTLVMTFVSMLLAALSLANDVTQPDHGPATIERLDRIQDLLGKRAEQAERNLSGTEVVVSKRMANIWRGPTTHSDVVGRFAPGDKAIVVGRTDAWVEIECVEPLSGATTRGWVYGKLVERMAKL